MPRPKPKKEPDPIERLCALWEGATDRKGLPNPVWIRSEQFSASLRRGLTSVNDLDADTILDAVALLRGQGATKDRRPVLERLQALLMVWQPSAGERWLLVNPDLGEKELVKRYRAARARLGFRNTPGRSRNAPLVLDALQPFDVLYHHELAGWSYERCARSLLPRGCSRKDAERHAKSARAFLRAGRARVSAQARFGVTR